MVLVYVLFVIDVIGVEVVKLCNFDVGMLFFKGKCEEIG